MKVWLVLTSIVFSIFFISTIQWNYGQEYGLCYPPPFQKEIKESDVVFVGYPVSIESSQNSSNIIVTFEIEKLIKGAATDTIQLNVGGFAVSEYPKKIEEKFRFLTFAKNFGDDDSLSAEFSICTNSGSLSEDNFYPYRLKLLDIFFTDKPPPPLKQLKDPRNIYGDYICAEELVHVRSGLNHRWACVTSSTAEKLVERGGWINLGY